MNVPDEKIEGWLDHMLSQADPGDSTHTLVLAHAKPGALGVAELESTYAVLAYVPTEQFPTIERFITVAISKLAHEARADGPIYLAVLAVEGVRVNLTNAGEEVENRARRMQGDGQLMDHELAEEVTFLYAACADGRRWHGKRWYRGARAGKKDGPLMLQPWQRDRSDRWSSARLLRAVVGLPW